MRRQQLIITSLILAAFAAGYFVRSSIGFATQAQESASVDLRGLDGASTEAMRIGKDEAAVTQSHNRISKPNFTLSARQLEAVLNMGMTDPVEVFDEMGLSATQIRLLQSEDLLSGMRDTFHSMDLRQATVHKDQKGSFIEISPFPSQRLEMIASFEESVRRIIDDERTPIIARALIARSGLLDVGLYRREIRLSQSSDGDPQKSEREYKEDGSCFRQDIGMASPKDLERWRKLLTVTPQ